MTITLNQFAGIVVTALISLVLWFLQRTISRHDTDIKDIQKEMNGIVTNYKDRFDDIKTTINNNHLELIKTIGALDDRFVNKTTCKYLEGK